MQEQTDRPRGLLKVILILSFIGSSFSMFTGLQNAMSNPSMERVDSFRKIFENIQDENAETEMFKEQAVEYIKNINLNIRAYGIWDLVFSFFSVMGVYLMFRLRKIGFHIYTGAQVLLLADVILFGGYSVFTVTMTFVFGFFTMLFIVMYASQLKHMH